MVGGDARSELFPRVFLPGPVEVWNSFVSLTYKGILPEYLEDSVVRLAVGAFWGIALGIPLGLLVGLSQRAHTRAVAAAAVLPGHRRHRLAADPGDLVRLRPRHDDLRDRLHGAVPGGAQHRARRALGPRQPAPRRAVASAPRSARVLWEVVLPGALPNIITGLRNGLGFGWRALIAAEIIVGTSGIGFLMFDARRAGSVVEILLGMIVLGMLWYIVDSWVLAPIERATGQRWGLVTR